MALDAIEVGSSANVWVWIARSIVSKAHAYRAETLTGVSLPEFVCGDDKLIDRSTSPRCFVDLRQCKISSGLCNFDNIRTGVSGFYTQHFKTPGNGSILRGQRSLRMGFGGRQADEALEYRT